MQIFILIFGLLFLFLFGSCSSVPGLENGRVEAMPAVNLFKPKGKASLTSNGGAQKNPKCSYSSSLRLSDRQTDPTLTLFYGEKISGLELSYEQYKRKRSTGQLSADFGRIGSGSSVETYLKYYGYKIGYTAEVFSYDFSSGIKLGPDYQLTPRVHLGFGGGIHRIKWILGANDLDGNIKERAKCLGYVPYGSLRFQVDMDVITLRIDQASSFGDFGEIATPYYDSFISLRWEVAPSVDLLFGIRKLKFDSEGHSANNKLKATTEFNGWTFGLYVVF